MYQLTRPPEAILWISHRYICIYLTLLQPMRNKQIKCYIFYSFDITTATDHKLCSRILDMLHVTSAGSDHMGFVCSLSPRRLIGTAEQVLNLPKCKTPLV
ncbi:hypothetical protein GDO81_021330 [Engystomops pustulosus]|uniref:Uncharacterized protein n=1 Tax=Engystomops pustulosus TaxID=76066 RepID=A0AAV6Z7N4_ENGPU|nr:hypothetical protein GDO81_021330 [Engystomops pustulosus]